MKATDIDWDVSMEDVYDRLYAMKESDAAKCLGVTESEFDSMSEGEREELADRLYEGSDTRRMELFHLPHEVEIPKDVDDDSVCDWLSEEFGFCCFGCYTV